MYGSSINIIFGTTFDKIDVDYDPTSMDPLLFNFIVDNIIPREKMTLAVENGNDTSNYSLFYGVFGGKIALPTIEY